ncbi:hypothetical protein SAMD00079811_00270 [Scytonema sp. HK-05]|nr:hypothetical protein SAMD00079811_00270 [Scytonema sp. HK-05]
MFPPHPTWKLSLEDLLFENFNGFAEVPTLYEVGWGWTAGNDENILNRIKLYCLTGRRMVEELPILVSGRDFM